MILKPYKEKVDATLWHEGEPIKIKSTVEFIDIPLAVLLEIYQKLKHPKWYQRLANNYIYNKFALEDVEQALNQMSFKVEYKYLKEVVKQKDLDGEEHKNNILDSIDEFENTYYNFFGLPQTMEFLASSIKKTKRELTSRNHKTYFEKEEEISAYQRGVDEATEKLGKKMLGDLIDFYK